MAKLKVMTMPTMARDELLARILRSNYTKALLKVRSALGELRILVADAPAEMPDEVIDSLNKFAKDTEKRIDEFIY